MILEKRKPGRPPKPLSEKIVWQHCGMLPSDAEYLMAEAESKDCSISEIVRRAIALYRDTQ